MLEIVEPNGFVAGAKRILIAILESPDETNGIANHFGDIANQPDDGDEGKGSNS